MTICRGIVKDNVVLLDKGARLPEGAAVEVRLLERSSTRQDVFARVRTRRITRHVSRWGCARSGRRHWRLQVPEDSR